MAQFLGYAVFLFLLRCLRRLRCLPAASEQVPAIGLAAHRPNVSRIVSRFSRTRSGGTPTLGA